MICSKTIFALHVDLILVHDAISGISNKPGKRPIFTLCKASVRATERDIIEVLASRTNGKTEVISRFDLPKAGEAVCFRLLRVSARLANSGFGWAPQPVSNNRRTIESVFMGLTRKK